MKNIQARFVIMCNASRDGKIHIDAAQEEWKREKSWKRS